MHNKSNVSNNSSSNNLFLFYGQQSYLLDMIASEIDLSNILHKSKYLSAHAPGTTYYYSQNEFNLRYQFLVPVMTFLFVVHWFNHALFEIVLITNNNYLNHNHNGNDKHHDPHLTYNQFEISCILFAPALSIILFSCMSVLCAFKFSPLKLVFLGFMIVFLATLFTCLTQQCRVYIPIDYFEASLAVYLLLSIIDFIPHFCIFLL
jgi:hypothetical protein